MRYDRIWFFNVLWKYWNSTSILYLLICMMVDQPAVRVAIGHGYIVFETDGGLNTVLIILCVHVSSIP